MFLAGEGRTPHPQPLSHKGRGEIDSLLPKGEGLGMRDKSQP